MALRISPLVASVCTAAWGVALIAAFLLNRHHDVAYLPGWLARAARELAAQPTIGAAGLFQSTGGVLIATLVVVAWWGLGSAILRFIVSSRELGSRALDWSIRCLLGAGAWSTLWLFVGLVKLYRTPVAVLALALGLALAAWAWRREEAVFAAKGPRPWPEIVLIALVTGLTLVAALAPPTTNDALLYHLALPKAYVAAGGMVQVEYSMASYFTLGVEMHALWSMLLGGLVSPRTAEAAAGATIFAFAPLTVFVTYGWARARALDRTWSTLAALMVAAIPSVYFVAAGQGVDVAMAGYAAVAIFAAGRWWTTLETAWLRLMVAAVGAALSIKLTAVALVVPLALIVLLRALQIERSKAGGRTSAGAAAATGLGALAAGGLLASPWYIRTWVWTGSPLFPYYPTLWPGEAPGWDAGRAQLLASLLSLYGGSSSLSDYLLSPLYVSVLAQPELPRAYEGVLGPAFLLGVPIVVWAFRRKSFDAEPRQAALVAAAIFVLWLMSAQVLRYVLPAMPALAVAIAAAGATVAWGQGAARLFRGLLLAAAAANALVVIAWFAELNPLAVVLGGEPRDRFLARRLDYYPYYEIVNRATPSDARVWLVNTTRDTYHLERPYFADYLFGAYTISHWVREAKDADELRARARARGLTHVLVRHDTLLDPARSPVVDDAEPADVNRARLERLYGFLTQGTRLVQGGAKFWLIELR